MYWTDWGDIPMIAQSGMDGSLPQIFITKDIYWPNGIHVDYYGQRIYWVDAKLQVIESIKLDKSDRRVSVYYNGIFIFHNFKCCLLIIIIRYLCF